MLKQVWYPFLLLAVIAWHADAPAASSPRIRITGEVKHPLNITMNDLHRFESVGARLNEVTRDETFHGVFTYRGVPLRTLLELAVVQKVQSGFSKSIDLAIVVKNSSGERVVLSWGEIFYRNPSDILVAYSATPVMPHKACSGCHAPEVFKKWSDPLKRDVPLPKLVVVNDFYSDRSLENITSVEVVNLPPPASSAKVERLFSPEFVVTGSEKQYSKVADISSFPHIELSAKQTGDGKGYHGLKRFSGVPLLEILRHAGIKPDLTSVCLISAPDGYRSLVSSGELLLAPYGRDVIIADRVNDGPLKKNGKFIALFPADLAADRWVKAVSKIEIIRIE